jgi:Na+/proline symporter
MDIQKLFPIFDQTTGFAIIGVYAIFVFILTSLFAKGFDKDKESFLVANRQIGFWQGSFSAGAAWIHAPGLFVAAQQGYNNGWPGVFWFSFGNFFSYIVFAYFINKFRNENGKLFTLSEYFKGKWGGFISLLIVIQMLLLTLQSLTIDLFAGSQSVAIVTGLSPIVVSALLVGIALTYSLRGGIKASIITDVVKIVMIFVGVAIVGYTVYSATGVQAILDGIAGKTGKGTSLWSDSFALGLLFGFGIPTLIGHFASAWTTNEGYQNAFSMKPNVAWKAYIAAPFYWLVLQLIGGPLGMIAASMHIDAGAKSGFVNLMVMATVVGPWLTLVFLITVFAGLISIIDTMLINSANIFGSDIHDYFKGKNPVLWGRVAMLGFAAVGITLANIPGLDLNTIFLFGKTFQLCFFIPVVMGILAPHFLTKWGFISGAAVGSLIGSPIYVWGLLLGGGPIVQVTGTLIQVFGAGLVCYIVSKYTAQKQVIITA